jgi:hypothetical protein
MRPSWNIVALLLATTPVVAPAQAPSEYLIKLDLVAKICRFTEWPAQSPTRNLYRPFVFGILGRSPFGDDLDRFYLKQSIKSKSVQIRYCRTLDDLESCDLVFICASEKDHLGSILGRTRQKAILTISDTPGFAKAGVMVNFTKEGGRLGLEVNAVAAKEGGIQFASGLLQFAKVVAS